MAKNEETVIVTARIPKALAKLIDEYCDQVEGLTRSHLIAICLSMELDRFNDTGGEDPIVLEDTIYIPDELETVAKWEARQES
jgi:metal-responsive CopG/Arc/MetJ family transcriptional regulator